MNDIELDRLLDAWQPPAPPPSLRAGLRRRFPHPARSRFGRTLRWGLAIAIASATLAVATDQAGSSGSLLAVYARRIYHTIMLNLELREASRVMARIRQTGAGVFVDGQPVSSALQFGPPSMMEVSIPGDGVYRIFLFNTDLLDGLKGWTLSGSLQGNVLHFQAGAKTVRIEFSKSVTDSEIPVSTHRVPD